MLAYSIVGTFMLENEHTESIKEALEIIKILETTVKAESLCY